MTNEEGFSLGSAVGQKFLESKDEGNASQEEDGDAEHDEAPGRHGGVGVAPSSEWDSGADVEEDGRVDDQIDDGWLLFGCELTLSKKGPSGHMASLQEKFESSVQR